MNELAQFLNYIIKVFTFNRVVHRVRDSRPYPVIPTRPLLLSLLLGVVVRAGSYLDIAKQTKRRRWQHLVHWSKRISDDAFHYVSERFYLEDLRQSLVSVNKDLKANKALESCKINGLLFLSLDANEHFHSRSRCCRAAAKGRARRPTLRAKSKRSSNTTTATSSPRSTGPSSTRCWTSNRFVRGKGKRRRRCVCWGGFGGATGRAFSTPSRSIVGMCKAHF